MRPINNLLSGLVQKSSSKNWKLYLVQNWPDIIGNLHQRVSLEQVYENSVLLGVHDSNWMQELYLMSRLIIKKINDSLEVPRITSVRFKATGIKKTNIKQIYSYTRQEKVMVLSAQERQALEKISDPLLRQALEELYKKCL